MRFTTHSVFIFSVSLILSGIAKAGDAHLSTPVSEHGQVKVRTEAPSNQPKLHSKFEEWADNEQAELQSIGALIQFGNAAQGLVAAALKLPVRRGAHAKGTCSQLDFKVENFEDAKYDAIRSKLYQFDFFKNPEPNYSGIARVSNGSPKTQADTVKDARGLAIEIKDSKGRAQDFVMINHPTFFTNSAKDYMTFQALVGKSGSGNPADLIALKTFLGAHPDIARITGEITSKQVSSYTTSQYWTGIASKFGENDVAKYTAIPCAGETAGVPAGAGPEYLQEDFKQKVAQPGGVCFELHIQFMDTENLSKAEITRLVEDPTIELKTPTYKIATVNLHGPVMSDAECEATKFNPVHKTFPGMEGIGRVARMRGAVYPASQLRRGN